METGTRRQNRHGRNLFAGAILLLLACVLLGGLAARYMSEQRKTEEAELAEYQVSVIDLHTGKDVDWKIELPATTKLYEDSYFDQAAVVKRLKITNHSEQDLILTAEMLEKIYEGSHGQEDPTAQARDIFLYIADGDIGTSGFCNLVKNGLAAEGVTAESLGADGSAMETVRTAITSHNTKVLQNWSGTLKPGDANSKYLSVILWRENDIDNTTQTTTETFYLNQHLRLSVEQTQ